MDINLKKNWWVVNVAAFAVGILVAELTERYFEGLATYGGIFLFTLLGLSFLWVFNTRRDLFWAIAPAVGCFAFAIAGFVSPLFPDNNGWVATLILGVAGFVIAAIPNPRPEMKVSYGIGAMVLVIGFLLAPISLFWKIISSIVVVGLAVYFLWRDREELRQVM
jgi:hypothetical protein